MHAAACSADWPHAVLPGAGKRQLDDVGPEQVAAAREASTHWLEDCIILLLCVLSLDR
jgi:hypothetical protein